MVVMEYMNGNAKVMIDDSKCVSREESVKLMEKFQQIVMMSQNAKYHRQKALEAQQKAAEQ